MTAKTIYGKLSALRPQGKEAPRSKIPARQEKKGAPMSVLLTESGIHLLLGAVLAGAVLFGESAPFGVPLWTSPPACGTAPRPSSPSRSTSLSGTGRSSAGPGPCL